MNYSTTYTNELIKLFGLIAIIFDFEFLPGQVEALAGAVMIIGSMAWTFYQRYKSGKEGRAGAINVFGVRK